MKLVIAPAAKEDLLEIKEYISVKLCNPTAAVNVVKRIIKDYRMLTDTPEIGIPLDRKIDVRTPYRFIVSSNYLVFYQINRDTIEIHRILYKGKDYFRILMPEEYANIHENSEDD